MDPVADFDLVPEGPSWLLEGGRPRVGTADPEGGGSRLTGLPIGRRTLLALRSGLPAPGEHETQRDVAVGVARNMREAGTPEPLALFSMEAILSNPNSALDPSNPWSVKDAKKIVTSVYQGSAPDRDQYADERSASTLQLRSLADAATVAQAEIDWVVPELLAAGEKALIAGPPKSLKTWFALHLARSIARAEPVLAESIWLPSEPQQVLFVQEEGNHQRWARRLMSVFDGELNHPFAYTHRAGFSLLNAAHVEWVISEAHASRARAVIVDPLQRVMPGVRENDATEMGPAWDAIHRISAETGAAVVVLHHSRKSGNGEPTMDSIRGSSRIAGEVDLMFVMRRAARDKLEVYLDGRDLARAADDGNLEVIVDSDRPHEMRVDAIRMVGPKMRRTTTSVALEVLREAGEALETAHVQAEVEARLGESRTRSAINTALKDLRSEDRARATSAGRGKSTLWESSNV